MGGEEGAIGAAAGEELLVRARFDRAALLDDVDAVGADDRLQAVGDDHRRAAHPQRVERRLHFALALRIERRGRLVEQQDRRVLQHRAGDGDALALAAGQLRPLLADAGVVAVGEAHDEIVGVGAARRLDDLRFGCADPPERDVVADRAAEQEHVLRDEGDLAAQRREVDGGDILAVDRRPPAAQRKEALDDAEDRRLAAARGADQGGRLAGLGDEIDAVERVLVRAIGEAAFLYEHDFSSNY